MNCAAPLSRSALRTTLTPKHIACFKAKTTASHLWGLTFLCQINLCNCYCNDSNTQAQFVAPVELNIFQRSEVIMSA